MNLIDEKPIGYDETFTVVCPIASEPKEGGLVIDGFVNGRQMEHLRFSILSMVFRLVMGRRMLN